MKVSVLIALLGAATVSANLQNCVFTSPKGATYDLRNLARPDGWFQVADKIGSTADQEWEYFYNFCGLFVGYPSTESTPEDSCRTTMGDDGTLNKEPASAWQLRKNGNECHRLGNTTMSFRPYMDVADGFEVSYTGGDYCLSSGGPRGVKISLFCEDTYTQPNATALIVEDTACNYHIHIHSGYGCPRECGPGVNDRLCSGNGVCGYDKTNNKARCFCYDGYKGDVCDTGGSPIELPPKDQHPGAIAGGFFGGLFTTIIAAAAVGFFYYKTTGNYLPPWVTGDSSIPKYKPAGPKGPALDRDSESNPYRPPEEPAAAGPVEGDLTGPLIE